MYSRITARVHAIHVSLRCIPLNPFVAITNAFKGFWPTLKQIRDLTMFVRLNETHCNSIASYMKLRNTSYIPYSFNSVAYVWVRGAKTT
jgi:hypothetical protein